jgi:putative oxidoreductase
MKGILCSPTPQSARYSVALLILRVVSGAAMMLHGLPKIQNPFEWAGPNAPFPGILLALAALSEFGGGIAWMLGLLTPLASLGIASTMAVAVFLVHIAKGDPFVAQPGATTGSYEPALGYLAIAVALFLMGPGRFSLDAILWKKCAHGTA